MESTTRLVSTAKLLFGLAGLSRFFYLLSQGERYPHHDLLVSRGGILMGALFAGFFAVGALELVFRQPFGSLEERWGALNWLGKAGVAAVSLVVVLLVTVVTVASVS